MKRVLYLVLRQLAGEERRGMKHFIFVIFIKWPIVRVGKITDGQDMKHAWQR
jgi:nitrate reductase NapE component